MAFIPFLGFEASAGSGKTFNLVVRYLSLLFLDIKPEKILALTFTNKAALEMNERIITTLINLENRKELNAIAETLECQPSQLLKTKDLILNKLLISELKIMTLDKFFAQILRKFSLYEGLQPTFTIKENIENIEVIKQMLNRTEIAKQQKCLIRLSLMTQKRLTDIFSLLQELYVKQEELLKFSFKATDHVILEKKVLDFGEKLKNIVLNSPTASQIAKNSVSFETVKDLISKSWIGRDSLNYATFKKCFKPEMDDLLYDLYSALKDYYKAIDSQFFYDIFSLLQLYSKSRMQVCKHSGELNFDDVTVILLHLLHNKINRDFIYFRLDSKVDHILLDEFQDTSVIQFEILRPLIDELVSGKGVSDHKSFFYVGDVKQSIYRFRGGNKALFHKVKNDFRVDLQQLNINYRSKKEIVNFVNQTFKDKIKNYHNQEVAQDTNEGFVEVFSSQTPIAKVCEAVLNLLNDGILSSDIAVLTWTNKDGLAVAQAIKSLDIQVLTQTTAKLINNPTVAGLIELLKYYYFNENIYFENFKALNNLTSIKPLAINMKELNLQKLIHHIIKVYNLYSGDQNLIRFINVASNYKDIDKFIFGIENESESLAQIDQVGVKVLTIFKAKGLEFEHVICMDLLGKKNIDKNPIIYHYDKTNLLNIFLRQKNRDKVDLSYKCAKDYNGIMIKEDEMNAIYVAFTRAKTSLFIIKKIKSSIFEPLCLEIASYGKKPKKKYKATKLTNIKPFWYEVVYVKAQENIKKEKIEKENHETIEFGLALHYTLEMLSSFKIDALKDAIIVMKNRFNITIDKAKEIKNRINMLLQNSQFLTMTNGKISKEQPLSIEGKLYYIDLLIEKNGSYIVIDYKSGRNGINNHKKQIQNYIYGVKKITNKPVKAYLIYLLTNEIIIENIETVNNFVSL